MAIAAVSSAAVSLAGKLIPGFVQIGGLLIVMGVDWSGVLVGSVFFLGKAVGGVVWLYLLSPTGTPPVQGGGLTLVLRLLALLGVLVVPALLATTAVELFPTQLRRPAIGVWLIAGAVILAMCLTMGGCWVGCRRRFSSAAAASAAHVPLPG